MSQVNKYKYKSGGGCDVGVCMYFAYQYTTIRVYVHKHVRV